MLNFKGVYLRHKYVHKTRMNGCYVLRCKNCWLRWGVGETNPFRSPRNVATRLTQENPGNTRVPPKMARWWKLAVAAAFGGAHAHSSSISSLEKAHGFLVFWVTEFSWSCLFVYQPHQPNFFSNLQVQPFRVYQNAGGEDAGRLEGRSHWGGNCWRGKL